MTRRLYLHIGNHKTGSTSLQGAMQNMQDERVFADYAVHPNQEKRGRWGGNSWLLRLNSDAKHGAMIDPALPHALASHNPDGDVVFSAEDFSWVFEKSEIEDFVSPLKEEFDQIILLVYLRRQDRNMISFYQEGLKWHPTRFSQFAGNEARSLPEYKPHFDRYFDYHARIGQWADVIGDEAVRIFDYDALLSEGGSLFEHFGAQTGLELPKKEEFWRKSHSHIRQLVHLRMVRLKKKIDLPRPMIKEVYEGEKMRPPRAAAMAFYEHFRKSNALLAQRFGGSENTAFFDDDFSEYPEKGNENWDENAADLAVDYLLLSLADAQAEIAKLKKEKEEKGA